VQSALKQLNERQHPLVQRDRQIVARVLEVGRDSGFELGTCRRFGERGRHGQQFVDRRRLVMLLRKPVALRERLHFVRADAVDEAIEVLADTRLGASAVRRLEEQIDGPIELLTRGFDVTELQLALTGSEELIRCIYQDQDRVWRGGRWLRNGLGDGNGGRRRWGRGLGDCRGAVPDAGSAGGRQRGDAEQKDSQLPVCGRSNHRPSRGCRKADPAIFHADSTL